MDSIKAQINKYTVYQSSASASVRHMQGEQQFSLSEGMGRLAEAEDTARRLDALEGVLDQLIARVRAGDLARASTVPPPRGARAVRVAVVALSCLAIVLGAAAVTAFDPASASYLTVLQESWERDGLGPSGRRGDLRAGRGRRRARVKRARR